MKSNCLKFILLIALVCQLSSCKANENGNSSDEATSATDISSSEAVSSENSRNTASESKDEITEYADSEYDNETVNNIYADYSDETDAYPYNKYESELKEYAANDPYDPYINEETISLEYSNQDKKLFISTDYKFYYFYDENGILNTAVALYDVTLPDSVNSNVSEKLENYVKRDRMTLESYLDDPEYLAYQDYVYICGIEPVGGTDDYFSFCVNEENEYHTFNINTGEEVSIYDLFTRQYILTGSRPSTETCNEALIKGIISEIENDNNQNYYDTIYDNYSDIITQCVNNGDYQWYFNNEGIFTVAFYPYVIAPGNTVFSVSTNYVYGFELTKPYTVKKYYGDEAGLYYIPDNDDMISISLTSDINSLDYYVDYLYENYPSAEITIDTPYSLGINDLSDVVTDVSSYITPRSETEKSEYMTPDEKILTVHIANNSDKEIKIDGMSVYYDNGDNWVPTKFNDGSYKHNININISAASEKSFEIDNSILDYMSLKSGFYKAVIASGEKYIVKDFYINAEIVDTNQVFSRESFDFMTDEQYEAFVAAYDVTNRYFGCSVGLPYDFKGTVDDFIGEICNGYTYGYALKKMKDFGYLDDYNNLVKNGGGDRGGNISLCGVDFEPISVNDDKIIFTSIEVHSFSDAPYEISYSYKNYKMEKTSAGWRFSDFDFWY